MKIIFLELEANLLCNALGGDVVGVDYRNQVRHADIDPDRSDSAALTD
ncbi:MAG: hypothetical protein ABI400_04810 [Lacisediminihabitans sp.]